MLAGIYTHTSAHILGAPMAHYNAMNESRFSFSHDDTYVPVHGLSGIIRDEQVTMRFRNRNGVIFHHHKAFNYLYRPLNMENMSVYEFYAETEFIQMSDTKKKPKMKLTKQTVKRTVKQTNKKTKKPKKIKKQVKKKIKKKPKEESQRPFFVYTEEHEYRDIEAVVFRTKADAVPSFPWSFLCSTKSFETSLMDSISPNAADYRKKEEYAFNFMLLFLPFRSKEDLGSGCSYQETLQKALKEGKIHNKMIQIAENIQTIHNSLASGITENTLTAETSLVEAGEFENPEEDDENYDDLMATIGELFANVANGDGLKEDSKTFDVKFGNKQVEATTLSNLELETVVEFNNPDEDQGNTRQEFYPKNRFSSTTNNLNTLAMQTTITRSQMNDDDNNETEKEIINANGTWQSISKWGENDGLDAGQQTAFEILAATYVLSFYDESIVEASNSQSYESFTEKRDSLSKLARRKSGNEDPLCMLITGPAGAGKCK
jgi:hypothetical protein